MQYSTLEYHKLKLLLFYNTIPNKKRQHESTKHNNTKKIRLRRKQNRTLQLLIFYNTKQTQMKQHKTI